MNVLHTIGHSTHPLDKLLELLARHSITAVADVRSSPYSRHNPQFNRETLKEALRRSGIAYVFLGEQLGARSSNPMCYEGNRVQYDRLAREPQFQLGLNRVREGLEQYRVALLCAEREPLECHRTILVCRELKTAGLQIAHIHSDGNVEPHEELERRMMKTLGLVPDLLQSEDRCLNAAYKAQGERIAYVKVAESDQAEVLA